MTLSFLVLLSTAASVINLISDKTHFLHRTIRIAMAAVQSQEGLEGAGRASWFSEDGP